MDRGEGVDVVFLDLAKAFDKVPHQRLLAKVRAHGVDGKVAAWIRAWLLGRKRRVCVEGAASLWRLVLSGVPQGSVLGPLLLIINDLELQIINTVLKFADDTTVFGTVIDEDDRAVLQEDLQKLSEWADSWQMEFNVEKCKVMHFGSRNNKFNYCTRGKQLEVVSVERDLGVIIASNLKVADHCQQAYATA